MNFINRAFLSIKSKSIKNILLIIVFSVLFTAALSVYLIFVASNAQVESSQKTIANAVTLIGPTVKSEDGLGSTTYEVLKNAAIDFVDSKYVEGYSIDGSISIFDTVDCETVLSEESEKLLAVSPTLLETAKKQCSMVAVSNSEYNVYFTAKGFQMTSGEEITPQDGTDNVALVSDAFAEINNLKVGDEFTLILPESFKEYYAVTSFEELTLTVKGTFSHPIYEDVFYQDSLSNLMFLPMRTSEKYHNKQLGIVTTGYSRVTVYLKNLEDLDLFLEETKEKIRIGMVSDQISESNSGETIFDDALYVSKEEINSGDYPHKIILDRAWYEMVAKPMEKVNSLTGVMVVAIVMGTALILALITVLTFKGRRSEFGVQLAIGEKSSKIFLQLLIEMLVPIFIAIMVGLAASSAISTVFSNYLITSNAEQTQESNAQMSEQYENENKGAFLLNDLTERNSYGVSVNMQINAKLTMNSALIYIIWILNITVLVVFAQMFILLRRSPASIIMDKRR